MPEVFPSDTLSTESLRSIYPGEYEGAGEILTL